MADGPAGQPEQGVERRVAVRLLARERPVKAERFPAPGRLRPRPRAAGGMPSRSPASRGSAARPDSTRTRLARDPGEPLPEPLLPLDGESFVPGHPVVVERRQEQGQGARGEEPRHDRIAPAARGTRTNVLSPSAKPPNGIRLPASRTESLDHDLATPRSDGSKSFGWNGVACVTRNTRTWTRSERRSERRPYLGAGLSYER